MKRELFDTRNSFLQIQPGTISLIKQGLIILFMVSLIFSCYYDSKEFLYPQLIVSCDTTSVTYSGSILPILSDNCYSCHNASNSSGNINLTDFNRVSNLATTLRNGTPVLSGVIRQLNGFTAMPPSGKLNECKINIIQKWIDSSASNN